eukprot:2873905-Prymnesium_polylepis.1
MSDAVDGRSAARSRNTIVRQNDSFPQIPLTLACGTSPALSLSALRRTARRPLALASDGRPLALASATAYRTPTVRRFPDVDVYQTFARRWPDVPDAQTSSRPDASRRCQTPRCPYHTRKI